MDEKTALQLLQALIDYFEVGNQETDAAAKAILENDFEYGEKWRTAGEELRAGTEWTGLRAPEAEIIASALRCLQGMVGGGKPA